MTNLFWVQLILSNGGFALGTVLLKKYADTGSLLWLTGAFAIFASANLIYARILAHGLGQAAALSSMGHVLLLVLVGTAMGERMTEDKIAALVLAGVAIWLFSRPAGTA